MDERAAMNVEFLRARLLSERIVSRTARQRSEMLSQRVMELEEQLRIVNIQRKKAEKAAKEVLSILETQGISCMVELSDSSTEQEDGKHTDQEGNQCISCKDIEEDEFLASSSSDKNRVYEGSSLSLKSHGSSLDSQQKQKTKLNRHRQNSSSQRPPGKSCRKVKRHDAISGSENELEKSPSPLHDAHGNGVTSHPDDLDESHECLFEASESKVEAFSVDSSTLCSDNQSGESRDVCGNDDGMERALENAQLIVLFRAMENAQRDWEAKFNETNMSLLENPEPGKLVKIPENPNRTGDNSRLAGRTPQHGEEETSNVVKDISFTEDKGKGRCRNCEMVSKKSVIDVIETVPKLITGKLRPKPKFEKPNPCPSSNKKAHPPERHLRYSTNEFIQVFSVPPHHNPRSPYENPDGFVPINSKANPTELALVTKEVPRHQPPATSSSLGGVLQSLRHARMSLGRELAKNPNPGPVKLGKALDFPISSSALFRLPSNVYGSELRLTATRPDLGFMAPTVSARNHPLNQSPSSSPYLQPGARVSAGLERVEQFPFYRHTDGMGARVRNGISKSSADLRSMKASGNGRSYGGDGSIEVVGQW